MRMSHSRLNTADIMTVEGRVDASTSKDLEDAVLALVRSGDGSIVLDFADVDYISSAGLRVLLVCLRALTEEGRDLALASVNPDVMDVVTLTGFDKLLICYDGLEDALAAARP